jgi:hypothetical protein
MTSCPAKCSPYKWSIFKQYVHSTSIALTTCRQSLQACCHAHSAAAKRGPPVTEHKLCLVCKTVQYLIIVLKARSEKTHL